MDIILVDDEVTMLEILKKVMPWEQMGIRKIYTARNAQEAKELFETKKIDLSVCDIEMPQESGLELIAWLQGLYPQVVNIILTGHPDFNYARSAISLGVYEFLLKPVAFEELERVIREAVRKLEEERFAASRAPIAGEAEPVERAAVDAVREYLEQHYPETITRNDIEKLVHLNRDYINREFKAYTGYTLMEYIQYCRIGAAKGLLREGKRTVTEISAAVGYDSPAYFGKIFKRQTGMTPLEYRQKSDLL